MLSQDEGEPAKSSIMDLLRPMPILVSLSGEEYYTCFSQPSLNVKGLVDVSSVLHFIFTESYKYAKKLYSNFILNKF